MHTFSDQQLLSACRVLFGPDVTLNQGFLWYLQTTGIKSAYRKRVKESHPDAHPLADAHLLALLRTQFNEITLAYQLLDSYLHRRGDSQKNGCYETSAEILQAGEVRSPASFTKESNNSRELLKGRSLPLVVIKTGRYLYLRGYTTFQSIPDALYWQRRQRPSMGVKARQWGWLDNTSVVAILRATHISGKFGERAVKLGYLSTYQKEMLLSFQQSSQQLIGRYFIQLGILSEAQLAALLGELHDHNQIVKSLQLSGRLSR